MIELLITYEEELIAGKKYLEWMYGSPLGKNITELIIKKKLFYKIYGMYCDTKGSANKIPEFVQKYKIDMTIAQKKVNEFNSFNDSFTRKLTSKARPINKDKNIIISPGDGRLIAYTKMEYVLS